MFPFTLAGTYTEANRLCRTLEVVKQKTMQNVSRRAKAQEGIIFLDNANDSISGKPGIMRCILI